MSRRWAAPVDDLEQYKALKGILGYRFVISWPYREISGCAYLMQILMV